MGIFSSGIFESHAQTYFDQGFSIIPINPADKKPVLKQWQKYSKTMPTQTEIDNWCQTYPDFSIGLVCGPASGICAFDYDYEYDEERVNITKQLFKKDKAQIDTNCLRDLPDSPLSKTGKKGWTRIYRIKDNDLIKNISIDRNGIVLYIL